MGGRNKALLSLDGSSILERIVRILGLVFQEIMVVTGSPEQCTSYRDQAFVVPDLIPGLGPLGGILTALSWTQSEAVFVVACDMPFLDTMMVEELIARYDGGHAEVVVPRRAGLIEPLHAVYRTSLRQRLEQFLQGSEPRSVRSFLDTARVAYWDLEDSDFHRTAFTNINTDQDLCAARRSGTNGGAACASVSNHQSVPSRGRRPSRDWPRQDWCDRGFVQ